MRGSGICAGNFAANPSAHHWLHESGDADHDQCAVMQFGVGLTVALDQIAIPLPTFVRGSGTADSPARFFLIAARYLRQTEQPQIRRPAPRGHLPADLMKIPSLFSALTKT